MKVAKALTNLFSGKQATRDGPPGYSHVSVEGVELPSLEKFRMIIQRDRIRSAAGAVLRRAATPEGVTVHLNKQVAYAGHVSFCQPEGESPLGPIRLLVETNDPYGVIDWITGGIVERQRK